MATLKDVARLAQVSVATVSHVINGSKDVSSAVTSRVLDAAKTLNYRRNRSARALRTGRSHALGLIVPDLINPYFPQLAQAITSKARALGYAISLIDATNDAQVEQEGMHLLAEHRVDGAIWIPVAGQYREAPPFPVVVVDRPIDNLDGVRADHYQGGQLVAEYLHALRHKQVGLISGPQDLVSAQLRRDGFIEAAKALDVVWEYEVPFSLDLPENVVEALEMRSVSVIVAANDVVAIGVLHVLEKLNIKVPHDVSVVGFDDIPWASLVRPQLTTIRQPLTLMGQRAVERMQKRIASSEMVESQELLPVELIERESVSRHE